jgi:hypothetical protein
MTSSVGRRTQTPKTSTTNRAGGAKKNTEAPPTNGPNKNEGPGGWKPTGGRPRPTVNPAPRPPPGDGNKGVDNGGGGGGGGTKGVDDRPRPTVNPAPRPPPGKVGG